METGSPGTLLQRSPYETAYLNVDVSLIMTGYNKQQSGVALVMGLVMLLLLTIIMLSAVQVTLLEERMAGNMKNTNIAFQAAESALRNAEAFIEGQVKGVYSSSNPFRPLNLINGPFQNTTDPLCVQGICGTISSSESVVISDLVEIDNAWKSADTGIEDIPEEPRYVIELVESYEIPGHAVRKATFRITARARGKDNSVVQLQSTYRVVVRSSSL